MKKDSYVKNKKTVDDYQSKTTMLSRNDDRELQEILDSLRLLRYWDPEPQHILPLYGSHAIAGCLSECAHIWPSPQTPFFG
ncbi:MAG: hypothetical protein ACXU97_08975, partial [Thermodesulfobacteriota bacterium]